MHRSNIGSSVDIDGSANWLIVGNYPEGEINFINLSTKRVYKVTEYGLDFNRFGSVVKINKNGNVVASSDPYYNNQKGAGFIHYIKTKNESPSFNNTNKNGTVTPGAAIDTSSPTHPNPLLAI